MDEGFSKMIFLIDDIHFELEFNPRIQYLFYTIFYRKHLCFSINVKEFPQTQVYIVTA